MEELKIKILEYALENAIKFKGKASQGAVIGKLMSYDSTIKQKMIDIAPIIGKTLKEVNTMSPEEQQQELLKLNPNFHSEQADKKKANKESRSDLPPLKNAEMGKVITRIAPEPSKYNHLGHAVSFLINYMYAKKYEGKCILRFDDTNPEKEAQEYVDAMQADVLEYLGIDASDTVFASDSNEKWIKIADQLIEKGEAYTCTCEQKDMSTNRRAMKECVCRSETVEHHKDVWELMKEGTSNAVLRLKIDMEHKNAVMRDPVIYRVITTHHYRQKDTYKVWPMYDFECAVIEGELGVTHVMRSNEFDSRIELQNYIRTVCGYDNHPEIKQYARFEVIGAITQGREIREKIESGEYIGWDDPRLVTLRALKRRGIVKEAYYELAKVIGMSKTNSKIDFSLISSINRKLLDESAKRFFLIEHPIEITIEGAPERELELKLHPEQDLGFRKFITNTEYIVDKKDFEQFKDDEVIRLIDNINFVNNKYLSDDYKDFKGNGSQIIHFLPACSGEHTKVEVLMPDNKIVEAIAERSIQELEVGEVVQFQRYGFCRLDAIKSDGTRVFWYTHE